MAKLLNPIVGVVQRKGFTNMGTKNPANRLPIVPTVRQVQRHGHEYSLYGVQENARNYPITKRPPKFTG
jgi:hypothetical protein